MQRLALASHAYIQFENKTVGDLYTTYTHNFPVFPYEEYQLKK
jgi:hypothetical protein